MKVAILYHHFLDDKGEKRLIGGIQTYLYNLAILFEENKWEPIIFQCAGIEFEKKVEGIKVIGIKRVRGNTFKNISALYQRAKDVVNIENDIIIFGADHASIKTDNNRAISIQHGISWDRAADKMRPNAPMINTLIGKTLWKAKINRNAKNIYENCTNRVCVDYNFLNWYKTIISGDISGNNWVIPNFSFIAERMLINEKVIEGERIRVLFARRFTDYRGSRIMADAALKILKEYNNVEFTFAGEGPDENWLKNKFINNDKVKFIKYMPEEAQKIHSSHHMSVVPSLASEGTSLSVVEAMSVGCVVIGASVGGITNMIINGYNGIMISPKTEEIYLSIKALLGSPEKRIKIAKCGYETAKNGFNIDIWKKRWVEVIKSI